ncbi:hypothetical protein [Chryseobacterium gambrini]|jgi:hypothetical protein|uniref:Uncharacterized protein n=1 Tax=Chryseobacterium gambrini TaxID=373672 RepID=A0ABN7CGK9_9FLAO|nr:hypothetical protein [Chryseobacterium gambrini]WBX95593.1 hypothetical protein PE065_11975 [Chryseobacterium gambrini]BEV05509.1 hypothetical protein CRDW_28830 [Chryseobacterium gambrini]
MKKIALVIFSAFSIGYYAQVGIKTTTPVGLLDINGDLNVNREMRMGGTNTVKGSAGVAGTMFHNNSELGVNDWKSIKIADGQGSMALFSMNTVSDQTGATFSGANGSTSPYTENSAINSNWVVLTGTQDTYSVTNTTNKVVFTFQTTAQKTNNSNSSSGFACGIFVDDVLKAVRTDVLIGTDGSYKIYNMNATLTNVTPKNNYKVKVACTKRNLNSGTLGIGTAVNTNFLNSDMSQSVLTTSVLQPY